MSSDIQDLKNRLPEFLERSGIEFDRSKSRPVIRCPDPAHGDEDPSATMYDGNRIHCHGCDHTWDIFDLAGLLTGKTEFVDQKNHVLETLGMPTEKKRKRKKTEKATLCPLTIEEGRKKYNRDDIQRFADYLKVGEFIKAWPYKTADGLIQMVEARFEKDGRKNVLSIYWDGKTLKSKNYPICLYNLDLLGKHDGPIIITEGAKAADAASEIPGFLGVAWNGGGKKAKSVKWAPLKDREVYIWPDDDRHTDKTTGELIPTNKQAGMATALYVQSKLPGSKIIPPIPEVREIRKSGADLVEVLEVKTPEEIAEYIRECEGYLPPSKKPLTMEELNGVPFKILGLSDVGLGHIISSENRLLSISMTSLTKTHLLNIADISYWETRFGDRGKIDWEQAINQIIRVTNVVDFDTSMVRGRGAWVEKDGRICYHDGRKTWGDPDPRKLYLRKNPKDIGLDDKPLDPSVCQEISAAVNKMSFETPADALRVLGWTALAPFAGALPWRPAGLITGNHATGKSKILELVVKPLANPVCFSGGGTTEAGVRQSIGNDALPIALDEAEDETPMKKKNKQALLSLMRQSTSNDAPVIAKGTKNQTGLSFQMRSMFLFLAISPEIEHAADDSRLFRANTARPDASQWNAVRNELQDLITERNCRAFRARTWGMLKRVIAQAEHVSNVIQEDTGLNNRFCLSEAMLLTAYWMIWHNMLDMTDKQILAASRVHLEMTTFAEPRDETGELIDRLLDERILVEIGGKRPHMTLREILIASRNGAVESHDGDMSGGILNHEDRHYMKNTAERLGFIVKDDLLAVASNHHEIVKISGHSRGYHLQIQRHPGFVRTEEIKMAGRPRTCIMLRGLLDFGDGEEVEKDGY
jgi:hypothetical protein